MKYINILLAIFGLMFPFGTVFAVTPDIISTKANPGVTIVILEGSVDPNGATATAWFEYGTSETLNNYKETVHLHIGSSNFPTPVKANITGLMPNTTYYFRLASDNGQNTVKGKTYSFTTMKDEYMTEKEEDTNFEEDTYSGKKEFEITTKENNLFVGEEVNFLITFKNNTSRNFEDTKISVELPKGIDFLESNFGKENNNTVTLNVDTLIPEQLGSLSIKGIITSEAEEKDLLVTTAVMTYKISESDKQEEKVAYATNKIKSEDSNLAASSNLSKHNNFLPNTLIDWLTLVLVVSGLILVGRNLYKDLPMQKESVRTLD